MYKIPKIQSANISGIETYAGETIEEKVNKILTQNEPIADGAQLNYTERKDGVKPEYDIRTDRFEHAIDAMERVTKSHIAKREERLKEASSDNVAKVIDMKGKKEVSKPENEVGKPESTPAQ